MRENKLCRNSRGYFSLVSLAEACGGILISLGEALLSDASVADVTVDSRSVKRGDVFVAVVGSREDGEAYAADAFERGASCVMCRRGGAERIGVSGIYLEVDDPFFALVEIASAVRNNGDWCVVGVTGSVGKTTVKELCIKVLSERYPTDGTHGNYNNILGLSLSVLNAFSVGKMRELHGKSQENRRKHLVLEMGISHVGEMDALALIARPDVAVITNIGSMHAEFLGGREGIAAEKARIAAYSDCRIICAGGEALLTELSRYTSASQITLVERTCQLEGGKNRSAYNLCGISGEDGGGGFEISVSARCDSDAELRRFTAPIVGKHGVTDSALAVALGLELGLSAVEIGNGLKRYAPIAMRQQIKNVGDKVRVIDCYNSGPESVRAALEAMAVYARTYNCKRRVAVLGDMLELGDASDSEHFRLGTELSGYGIEILFTVGKSAELIAEGAIRSGFDRSCVFSFGTDTEAEIIEKSVESRLLIGDIILYKASRGIGLERLIPNGAEE